AKLAAHYEQAIADARRETAAETERTVSASLGTQHEQAIAAVKSRAAADAERDSQAKLVAARAEWDEQLNAQVAAVRTEAARAAAEAQKAAADAEARIRAELEEVRDEAISTVRRSTEIELESGRRRAAREIETERERSNSIIEEAKAAIENERQRAKNDIDGERQRAATELEQERQRAASELDQVRQRATSELEQERQRATSEIEKERQRAASEFEQERQRATTELEQERQRLRAEFEAARHEIELDLARAREEAAAAGARAATASELAAAEVARAEAASRDAAASSAGAASAAIYDRVATGIRTLDDAPTLGASLDALVAGAATIVGRAALFIIDGDRLKPWKSDGFPDADVRSIESSIGAGDLLARAIQAARPTASDPELPAPAFARLPPGHASVAVPLMIAGRAIAVLYVDGGEEATSTSGEWQGAVDLLARHTSALLALRTAMRTFDMIRGVPEHGTNGASGEDGARRYAKLLVSEIKLYNEGAVRVGRQKRDLLRRLAAEIERAQRLYEERVPAAVSSRDAFFRQELVQTLADGDATLLGN
ncbi:MAG TPA: hypothetical protein VH138_14185, partial [Vicinamibacterales bacterium]|nr:hypothetical protein [Vicinamibacterales bacterium]